MMQGRGPPSEIALVSSNVHGQASQQQCHCICVISSHKWNIYMHFVHERTVCHHTLVGIFYYMYTDIDECEEGNSGCDPLRESCTNLVGGFSCHCLPEYVRVEEECQCELKV